MTWKQRWEHDSQHLDRGVSRKDPGARDFGRTALIVALGAAVVGAVAALWSQWRAL